jgi:hypothetical protein
MLVHAPYHTSHISFVSDNFITWQFTQHPFTLNIVQNIDIITQNFLESIGADHLPAVEALLVLLCYCCCTTPMIPPAITGSSHKFSSFKDMFYNNHINS